MALMRVGAALLTLALVASVQGEVEFPTAEALVANIKAGGEMPHEEMMGQTRAPEDREEVAKVISEAKLGSAALTELSQLEQPAAVLEDASGRGLPGIPDEFLSEEHDASARSTLDQIATAADETLERFKKHSHKKKKAAKKHSHKKKHSH